MSEKPKEDEDSTIDFSKVKSWFKKPAKKHTHHAAEHHTEHHSEQSTHHHKEEDTEVKFDYKDTLSFFKKYATVFLILIPIILTIYIRLQPMYLPATDAWATSSVYNYYKGQISTQVNQQYPNLPDANKNALIETEFSKFIAQNKDMVTQQVQATSQHFKDQMMYESGNSKYVYLGDIDSYFWLRDARKYINNGTMCDEIDFDKGLCYVDVYTTAPLKGGSPLKETGITKNSRFYAYVIAYVYKILKVFSPDMTIMQASFYTPLLFGIITAILAFLIGKSIAGNIGGLVTSIIISVNPIHLSRTLGSDNDPLNTFFPLLIVFFLIYTLEASNLKKRILYGVLTGTSMALFAIAWQGWWFMFNFIFATLAIYAIFHIIKEFLKHKKIIASLKTKETKNILTVILTIFCSTGLFVTIMYGFDKFLSFITGPLWFVKTKEAALQSFWPNVLVTVAEFNPGSLGTVIEQMGGKLLFFLGLMGVILAITAREEKISKEQKYLLAIGAIIYLVLISNFGINLNPKVFMALLALPVIIGLILMLKTEKESDVKMAILLVIWFIATTYAALKGVRFTLLMVSAFGVAFGITIAAIYRTISKWVSSELKINENLTKTIVAVLLLLVLISPVKAGYYTAGNYIPSVNDAWYDSLTKIKDNSKTDAIINSWWDFGHWFKFIADRRVTLDGSSQGGPPLHWLGKLMVTDDEKHSVGILRMLDCGSNTAFDKLNGVINETHRSIDILDNIVTLEKNDAEKYLLSKGLDKKQAAEVIKYTHCEPPENFFITSEDMVGKAGVWAHFGSWDFRRAEMYTLVKGTGIADGKRILSDPDYNLTPELIEQYYYEIQTQDDNSWITPWPGYMSGVQPCEKPRSDGVMICTQQISNGQIIPLIVNLTTMEITMSAKEEYHPKSFVYVTENGTEEKKYESNTLEFSVVLVPSGEGYSTLITHPYLANSMFTRLFYLGGHGLSYFDKFDDQRGVTGGRILVWKVDWEGKDANSAYTKVDATELSEEKRKTNETTTNRTAKNTATKKMANATKKPAEVNSTDKSEP
jgi:dolichyl-diphosphooligosaccharide--protein glycosyltransferase